MHHTHHNLISFNLHYTVQLYMLQPCHLIVLLQGIALVSKGKAGVYISLFMLPYLTGCVLAIIVPGDFGLEYFLEWEAYWVEHYLITTVTPIYLLVRNNCAVLNMTTTKTVLFGVFFLLGSHWMIYDPICAIFKANIEFMMCPTPSMSELFSTLPPSLFNKPSYRTTLAALMILGLSPVVAYGYIGVARIVQSVFGLDANTKSKNT